MSKVIESKKFIFVDSRNNNNKFWEYELYDDGKVIAKWGRVAANNPESGEWFGGKSYVDSKVKEKIKKGYKEIEILGTIESSGKSIGNTKLADVAVKEISQGCPIVSKLVKYLAEVNRHNILEASGGQISVNITTGVVTTPLGIIGASTITEARDYLKKLSPFVKAKDFENDNFINNLNEYLKLCPQKVGHKKGWYAEFITTNKDLEKQNDLLDALESSISAVTTNPQDNKNDKKTFDIKMSLVTDKDIFGRINKKYIDSRKDMHSGVYNLKLINLYSIDINSMKERYDRIGAKMKNIMELWHGSSAANCLSILRSGLQNPPKTDPHVCGLMFGSYGPYFSNISTKSLQYSAKGNYGGSCFMFMLDVAMGNYYVPSGSTSDNPPSGYHSYWAKPGQSGIINDEMIVPVEQTNIKYLLEFK